MSHKSRGNWTVMVCLKDCTNKGVKCVECVRFSKYIPRDVPNKSIQDKGSDRSVTGV